MFLIREVFPDDLPQLLEVARHLNTVNLPNDRPLLERIIDLSRRSFGGEVPPFEREYLFVMVDTEAKRVIGTGMIHAQHGTRRAPHVFFEVQEDERYSETLDRHFRHRCLRIGYNYEGMTEIGGLILLPEYRGRGQSLGKVLSYVRFLYIGLHRDRFRGELLSELLPELQPDGTSLLWENLGRHFTGLSYQEADRLSKDNKEFIRNLFPQGLIYTVLLPKEVQAQIGVVGAQTKSVQKMLEAIGFTYSERIDPFDGGPHFQARTDDVTLVKQTRRARVVSAESADAGKRGIVSSAHPAAPHFLATGAKFRLGAGGSEIGLTDSLRTMLGVKPGDEVGYVEL